MTFNDLPLKHLFKASKKVWLFNQPAAVVQHITRECNEECIKDALNWAKLLGSSSKAGFSAVFKSLEKIDFIRPNFKFLINLLFKQLVGTKVLDVFGAKEHISSYGFCSKAQGTAVLMLVNSEPNPVNVQIKTSGGLRKSKKGALFEYIVGACNNGKICLNRGKPKEDFEPVELQMENKKSIQVPASSVAFYVIPDSDVPACATSETFEEKSEEMIDSMDELIRDLITENLSHIKVLQRTKRTADPHEPLDIDSIDSSPFLIPAKSIAAKIPREKKEVFGPPKNLFTRDVTRTRRHLPHLPFFKLRKSGPEPTEPTPVARPKVKIPGIENIESSVEKIFASSENEDLPLGEMHFDVAAKEQVEAEYDYVQFEDEPVTTQASRRRQKPPAKKHRSEDLALKIDGRDDNEMFYDFGGGEPINQKPFEITDDSLELSVKTTSSKSDKKAPKTENVKYAVLVKGGQPNPQKDQLEMKKVQKKVAALSQPDADFSVESDFESQPDVDYFYDGDEKTPDYDESEVQEKTKRHSLVQSERFMSAFARLLQKMERIFEQEEEEQQRASINTRRRKRLAVDSVDVPRRRTRKDIREKIKGVIKSLPKFSQPLDINNVEQQPIRKKRDLQSVFYEIDSNQNDGVIEFIPIESSENDEENQISQELPTTTAQPRKSLDFFSTVMDDFLRPFLDIFLRVKDESLKFFKSFSK